MSYEHDADLIESRLRSLNRAIQEASDDGLQVELLIVRDGESDKVAVRRISKTISHSLAPLATELEGG